MDNLHKTPISVINEFYSAFERGDAETALATLSSDIRWMEAEDFPYADQNPYLGIEQVRSMFGRVIADWDDLAIHIHEILPIGEDKVIVEGRYAGKFRATGKVMDCQMAHIWTVKNGKSTCFQQYANTAHVRDTINP